MRGAVGIIMIIKIIIIIITPRPAQPSPTLAAVGPFAASRSPLLGKL